MQLYEYASALVGCGELGVGARFFRNGYSKLFKILHIYSVTNKQSNTISITLRITKLYENNSLQ